MFHMEHSSVIRETPPPSRITSRARGLVQQHLAEAGERGVSGGVPALVAVVQSGIPYAEFEALREQLDLSAERLASYLGMPRATLHRRKIGGQLSPDDSDKVLRFARLLGQAARLFGSVEDARRWLSAPQHGLGGAVPLEFAGTEVGAREVESLLGRIDYGVYS
jgi:putative toxin-antitoxin system antitoxin component (TIGR02293 family)